MTRSWRPAVAAVALCLAAASTVGAARAMTLEEALLSALRTNPDLGAARDGARARHEGVALALSAWRPRVEATLSGGLSRRETTTDEGVPTLQLDENNNRVVRPLSDIDATDRAQEKSAALSLSHNLYRGGADSASLRGAEEDVRQSHDTVRSIEQRVALETATVYLDTLRAERTVVARDKSLTSLDGRLRQVMARFRVGDRTAADVARAEAERAYAAANAAAARTDLANQRVRFESIVGQPPKNLELPRPPQGLPASYEEALELALQQPSVRAADAAVRAAGHRVTAALGQAGPRVDWSASLSASDTRYDDWTDLQRYKKSGAVEQRIGIRLTVPLYEGGGASARIRQAKRARDQAMGESLVAQRTATLEAGQAWHSLATARQRHEALERAVVAARAALTQVRRQAEVDESSLTDILDAESDLTTREVDALGAERDVILEGYRLLSAVGRLTAADIGLADAPDLDAEAAETRGRLEPGSLEFFRSGLGGGD